MAVTRTGKNAETEFEVIKRYTEFTLVKINIQTGRTHQIRVHMAEIGHPVIGDSVYSNGKNPYGIEGQMLHSSEIEFVHPTTGKRMHLKAELPEYFKDVLGELDRNN